MVPDMFVAGAGNDHAAALDGAFLPGRLQGNRHFRPQIERSRTPEFNAAFVDHDRIGGKLKAGLARFDGNLLLKRTNTFKFSCTHKNSLK